MTWSQLTRVESSSICPYNSGTCTARTRPAGLSDNDLLQRMKSHGRHGPRVKVKVLAFNDVVIVDPSGSDDPRFQHENYGKNKTQRVDRKRFISGENSQW